ncbi:uncharacterized protein N7515_002523 [Penicillium bovifimosum]|uniref:Uncharacterized protein n=1 Tax=Penicillium bovifimosum TaxID=126998 RepID=A0A9W9HDJ7_9EURO|nr:uncharacterized protein N7515_002523 [Penicillium bovifimosum]KAJ5143736.1 hypothetical protein N7515_002523 [Penicillium bovifimosum]
MIRSMSFAHETVTLEQKWKALYHFDIFHIPPWAFLLVRYDWIGAPFATMAREIPGFYYDEDKKKYFKIEANHAAAPNAQYSQQSVKRRRIEKETREKTAQSQQRIAKETVRKATSLRHPLVNLQREMGILGFSSTARQEQRARIQASQLHRTDLHRFEPWPNTYGISHVLRNPRSGTLIASTARGAESSVSVCFPDIEGSQWTYDQTMERMLFREPYWIGSMSLSQTGYLLATMNNGPQGDTFLSVHRLPEPDEGGNYVWPICLSVLHPIRIRADYKMSLWSSAAQPSGSSTHFAIGTSEGLHTLEATDNSWVLYKKPYNGGTELDNGKGSKYRKHKKSVHAVEWLSPTVIAAGQKSCRIFLHDLRSAGSVTRLRHNDSVMDMKCMDEHRLVAAGPSSLRMYDLRFAPTASAYSPTPPYLPFPDYSSPPSPNFDLSPELGLLANPTQDCQVQIFSLQTGRQVDSPLKGHRYSELPTCVRFEYGNDTPEWRGPQAPTLLVGAGDVVEQWTW